MEKLIKILNKFDTLRDYFLNNKIKWDEAAVAECFKPCAEEILCGGYFLVNGKYIIDLGSIELYYHEEDEKDERGNTMKRSPIKDHIMYHTNEHPSKSEVFMLNNGYPYFKIGSFNLHQSGVDVTFENETKKYRASFLIRSYRVFNKNEENKVYDLSYPFDKCSTHIFDDMFYGGILFDTMDQTTIEWIELKTSKEENIEEPSPRMNVAWYKQNENKFEKVTEEDYKLHEKEFDNDGYSKPINYPQFFPYNKKSYLQDPRLWQFKRKDIKEQ